MKTLERIAERFCTALEDDAEEKVEMFERRMDAITRTVTTITLTTACSLVFLVGATEWLLNR